MNCSVLLLDIEQLPSSESIVSMKLVAEVIVDWLVDFEFA